MKTTRELFVACKNSHVVITNGVERSSHPYAEWGKDYFTALKYAVIHEQGTHIFDTILDEHMIPASFFGRNMSE